MEKAATPPSPSVGGVADELLANLGFDAFGRSVTPTRPTTAVSPQPQPLPQPPPQPPQPQQPRPTVDGLPDQPTYLAPVPPELQHLAHGRHRHARTESAVTEGAKRRHARNESLASAVSAAASQVEGSSACGGSVASLPVTLDHADSAGEEKAKRGKSARDLLGRLKRLKKKKGEDDKEQDRERERAKDKDKDRGADSEAREKDKAKGRKDKDKKDKKDKAAKKKSSRDKAADEAPATELQPADLAVPRSPALSPTKGLSLSPKMTARDVATSPPAGSASGRFGLTRSEVRRAPLIARGLVAPLSAANAVDSDSDDENERSDLGSAASGSSSRRAGVVGAAEWAPAESAPAEHPEGERGHASVLSLSRLRMRKSMYAGEQFKEDAMSDHYDDEVRPFGWNTMVKVDGWVRQRVAEISGSTSTAMRERSASMDHSERPVTPNLSDGGQKLHIKLPRATSFTKTIAKAREDPPTPTVSRWASAGVAGSPCIGGIEMQSMGSEGFDQGEFDDYTSGFSSTDERGRSPQHAAQASSTTPEPAVDKETLRRRRKEAAMTRAVLRRLRECSSSRLALTRDGAAIPTVRATLSSGRMAATETELAAAAAVQARADAGASLGDPTVSSELRHLATLYDSTALRVSQALSSELPLREQLARAREAADELERRVEEFERQSAARRSSGLFAAVAWLERAAREVSHAAWTTTPLTRSSLALGSSLYWGMWQTLRGITQYGWS
eukprot:m51a1_g3360 hypothetical protein (731) ;mRNA; r:437088-439405